MEEEKTPPSPPHLPVAASGAVFWVWVTSVLSPLRTLFLIWSEMGSPEEVEMDRLSNTRSSDSPAEPTCRAVLSPEHLITSRYRQMEGAFGEKQPQ